MNSAVSHLLFNSSKRVGTKAVLKGVSDQEIRCVILAKDTDTHVAEKVKALCLKHGVEIIEFPSKHELGRLCSLDVACACVGIIK